MEEEKKEIEIRSDEVQEILSHAPNWMIRWGITLIFILILLVLFLSWFIKYPDVVEGKVVLTTQQPPSRLVSQVNGYIEELIIPNGSSVLSGNIIAEIRSPIRKSSIDSLHAILKQGESRSIIRELAELSDLGGIQGDINMLVENLIEYQEITNDGYYRKSILNLTGQIGFNNRLARITKEELDLLKSEMSNAREKFEADSILYSKKVIAKHTFYSNQSDFFAKKQLLINTKKTYLQHRIASSNYEKQRIDLKKSFEDKQRQLETSIETSRKTIKNAIVNWQQSYTLTSPVDGRLTYLSSLSNNQYVSSQEPLFAVIPGGESVEGVISIVDQAFGKVQLHQKVRMKFNNYPSQEFGQLIGEVIEISKIPSEKGYFVKVSLTKGLETTYNKKIQYKPEMSGTAEIITEELRLIERIFHSFRNILDK